ncbi:hypothetical protein [Hamadaea tsunoensis]|uniref:hypothetical protein n=1 Tax=Hamadaea tsunoensis TaxID=53368 RepID=UPI00040934B1|nr:hypothetical protein [Hamadaea tsunoensis]
MQVSVPVPAYPHLLLRRVAATLRSGTAFADRVRLPRVAAPTGPVPPPTWTTVPGSAIATEAQRFVAYRHGDAEVRVHATTGLDHPAPAEGLVARLTLGSHPVRVHADGTPGGYEARWTDGGAAYQLSARPVSLAEFMELLLSMDWN